MLQGIFSLFDSYAEKQIKISMILINDFNNNSSIEKNNSSYDYENIQSSINIILFDEKRMEYMLNGMIFSDKIFQKKIKSIHVEKEISQGILYIKHFVEIRQYKRSKFDSICYYLYSKKEKIKLPKNIISIKIELFEGIIEKNKQTDFVLTAETYLTI